MLVALSRGIKAHDDEVAALCPQTSCIVWPAERKKWPDLSQAMVAVYLNPISLQTDGERNRGRTDGRGMVMDIKEDHSVVPRAVVDASISCELAFSRLRLTT